MKNMKACGSLIQFWNSNNYDKLTCMNVRKYDFTKV